MGHLRAVRPSIAPMTGCPHSYGTLVWLACIPTLLKTLARLHSKALSTEGGEMSGENGRIYLFQPRHRQVRIAKELAHLLPAYKSHDTLSPISICTLLSCAVPYRFYSILLRTGAIYSPDSRNRETLQRREQQIQHQA